MASKLEDVDQPILCLVTDVQRAGGEDELLRITAEAVRGGVNMVQVRGHELDDRTLVRIASAIASEAGDDTTVVLNGKPELAADAGVAGVHLREYVTLDRANVDTGMLVGQSVHSVESAVAAQEAGVDYLIVGTVFPSASHPGGVTGGTQLVRAVTAKVTVPVIGIGGITADNAGEVVFAGAAGVAVIGAIIGGDDPFEAARTLKASLQVTE